MALLKGYQVARSYGVRLDDRLFTPSSLERGE